LQGHAVTTVPCAGAIFLPMETKTSSILKRFAAIVAVTARSYGLPQPRVALPQH